MDERTQALGEERDRVEILLRITTELSASLDQDRVLNRALELVNEFVNATQGGILLIDPETGQLVYRAAFGTASPVPSSPGPSWIEEYHPASIRPIVSHDTPRRYPSLLSALRASSSFGSSSTAFL